MVPTLQLKAAAGGWLWLPEEKKRAETKRNHAQALRTGGWQLEVCAPRFGHKLGRGLGRMADTPLCLSDRRAIVYSNYWD